MGLSLPSFHGNFTHELRIVMKLSPIRIMYFDNRKCSPHSSRLARLSLPLVETVFSLTGTSLQTLAQVSTEWHTYAWEIACAAKLGSCRVVASTANGALSSRSNFLALRNQLTMIRARVRDVYVDLTGFQGASLDAWSVLFAHIPRAETLATQQLNGADANGSVAILYAAAKFCPRLQGLNFVCTPSQEFRQLLPRIPEAATRALVECLPSWTPRGGLRHLPTWTLGSSTCDDASMYVSAIAAYCPRLESFCGCNQSPSGQWLIDMDTWEQFNTSCTQLTAFTWTSVPFATPYLEVFGHHMKALLTKLILEPSQLSATTVPAHLVSRLGFTLDSTPRHPQVVLRACPALRELRILLPPNAVGNRDLFGDAFCTALAVHCPRLERFEITKDRGSPPIASCTDKALEGLSSLPMLTIVDQFHAVNITGDGLFALVLEHAQSDWKLQRKYVFTLGDTDHLELFYRTIRRILERFRYWNQGDPATTPQALDRVILRVVNGSNHSVRSERSVQDLIRIAKLSEMKIPHIKFHIVVTQPGFDRRGALLSFDTVAEFALCTSSANSPTTNWLLGPNDWRIDDVFIARGPDMFTVPSSDSESDLDHVDIGTHVNNSLHDSDSDRNSFSNYWDCNTYSDSDSNDETDRRSDGVEEGSGDYSKTSSEWDSDSSCGEPNIDELGSDEDGDSDSDESINTPCSDPDEDESGSDPDSGPSSTIDVHGYSDQDTHDSASNRLDDDAAAWASESDNSCDWYPDDLGGGPDSDPNSDPDDDLDLDSDPHDDLDSDPDNDLDSDPEGYSDY